MTHEDEGSKGDVVNLVVGSGESVMMIAACSSISLSTSSL